MTWHVYTRDDNLARAGMLEFDRLTVNLRWLSGSAFELVGHTDELGHVDVGTGLLAVRDGTTVLSGVVATKERDRQGDDDRTVLTGIDDLARINHRIVYPDPTLPADDDLQPGYDVRTGPAEDVIAAYVEANAGPSALDDGTEDRRIPGLTVATTQGRGDTVTGRGRWQPTVDYMATMAERGGVGFKAVQQLGTSTISFEVVVPEQRPGVRFDVDGLHGTGALSRFGYSTAIPQVTWAIAGGRGELENRLVRQQSQDADVWGRIERFLDQNNAGDDGDLASQQDDLDAALADALREGAAPVDLTLEAVDTAAARWPDDFLLGDRVRVKIEGQWMWRQVVGLTVGWSADGETVTPRLGDASRQAVIRLLGRIGELERKVAERGRA